MKTGHILLINIFLRHFSAMVFLATAGLFMRSGLIPGTEQAISYGIMSNIALLLYILSFIIDFKCRLKLGDVGIFVWAAIGASPWALLIALSFITGDGFNVLLGLIGFFVCIPVSVVAYIVVAILDFSRYRKLRVQEDVS